MFVQENVARYTSRLSLNESEMSPSTLDAEAAIAVCLPQLLFDEGAEEEAEAEADVAIAA